jgi:ceramide glucosyltransferase
MTTWEPFVTLLVAVSVLALVVSSVSRISVWAVVRHKPLINRSSASVSILKPLCGAEPSLSGNLEAFSRQSHANLNIVFGVAGVGDDALPVALRFCRDHGGVSTRISVGEYSRLDNPKLALLERMSWVSDGEWLVVSDSNVRVDERYVEDALAHAAPDVGLVTHLVTGSGGRSVAAMFENLQLNCFVAPGVCGVRLIAGRTCVIGKSMFLRRDALRRIGGFEAAGSFLAEDYVIGRAIEQAGYRVVTSALPVRAWNEGWTLGRFISRHLRWAVMRRRVSRPAYMTELLLTPVPPLAALLGVGLLSPATGINVVWVGVSLLIEQLLDAVTFTRMSGQRVPLTAVALNPLRQCLTFVIWVCGWFVQIVEWRGRSYRVGPGSKLEPIERSEPIEQLSRRARR